MVKNEDALICDFAETYHVLDWRALPVKLAATLACGLRGNSRSVQLLTGSKVTDEQLLLAAVADGVKLISWQLGGDKKNRPESIVQRLTEAKQQAVGFASVDEFRAWHKKHMEG